MRLGRNKSPVMLYLLHCGNLYGTERMALATLAGMDGYDRRVVFAPPPSGSASVVEAARNVGYDAVTFLGRWSLLRSLLPWFVRYGSIDVIGTGVVHSIACHLLAKVFFVRLRQLHVAHGGTPGSFDQKHVLNRLPVTVVAVSEYVRELLTQRGVRSDHIEVIDNFLSTEQYNARVFRPRYDLAPPKGRPLDPDRVRVAIVSRVDPMKRVDLILDAIEAHGLGQFQFHVYGVGTEFERLTARAKPLTNIRFHGYVADVKNRLADADFLLQPCAVEPFGLNVLEAFLARLVVIVPSAGGSSRLVEDGVTGCRFAADDVDDLVRILFDLRSRSAAELQRLADAGAAAIETRFSQAAGAKHYSAALADTTRRYAAR